MTLKSLDLRRMKLSRSWHWGREKYDDVVEHVFDTSGAVRRGCDGGSVSGIIIGRAQIRCESCRVKVKEWEQEVRRIAQEEEASIDRCWAL